MITACTNIEDNLRAPLFSSPNKHTTTWKNISSKQRNIEGRLRSRLNVIVATTRQKKRRCTHREIPWIGKKYSKSTSTSQNADITLRINAFHNTLPWNHPSYHSIITTYTTRFNIAKPCILPVQCIFCTIITIKSNSYSPSQHSKDYLHSWDGLRSKRRRISCTLPQGMDLLVPTANAVFLAKLSTLHCMLSVRPSQI